MSAVSSVVLFDKHNDKQQNQVPNDKSVFGHKLFEYSPGPQSPHASSTSPSSHTHRDDSVSPATSPHNQTQPTDLSNSVSKESPTNQVSQIGCNLFSTASSASTPFASPGSTCTQFPNMLGAIGTNTVPAGAVNSVSAETLQNAWMSLQQRTYLLTAAAVNGQLPCEQPVDVPQQATANPQPTVDNQPSETSNVAVASDQSPKSKRKQYQPQRTDIKSDESITSADTNKVSDEPVRKRARSQSPSTEPIVGADKPANDTLAQDNKQDVMAAQRQYLIDLVTQQQRNVQQQQQMTSSTDTPNKSPTLAFHEESSRDMRQLGDTLKTQLLSSVSSTVDRLFANLLRDYQNRAVALQAQLKMFNDQVQQIQQIQQQAQPQFNPLNSFGARAPFFLNPLFAANASAMTAYNNAAQTLGANNMTSALHTPQSAAAAALSIFPSGTASVQQYLSNLAQQQHSSSSTPANKDDASPFNTNNSATTPARKKRSKVTDTRLSKLPIGTECSPTNDSPNVGYMPPTMVGQSVFGNGQSFSTDGMDDLGVDTTTPDFDSISCADMSFDGQKSCTLSPMHLRKAKLMFFYCRYPSSTLLKTFFPDIGFNKHNTAQLVKWFSNFREFYYIQMEKYAKLSLKEGVTRADDLVVTTECELYKVLNQHYNRNNHIQVPHLFRNVVEATLREFFTSIQTGKDAEPSWKKQIYKVIARLDQAIPEFFKNSNFLEQLE